MRMNSEEHRNLVDVIRNVHRKLRAALFASGDPNKIWAEHLQEFDLRDKYSRAMYKLATEVWKGKESRIEWAYKACLDYFYGGGLEKSLMRQLKLQAIKKQLTDIRKNEYEDLIKKNNYANLKRKLKLLDVGSCYNPFSKFEEFSCVAIDLTPATKDVLQCDFLALEIKSRTEDCWSENHSCLFCKENYDIVVLSLMLEYLPSPEQRLLCCYKSWQLLQENGFCVIITPDSKSVNHNTHMMKSWKLALEQVGFVRVKYDKLQHLHCMAFRKIRKERDKFLCWNSVAHHLFIPQDFKVPVIKESNNERTDEECFKISSDFQELPSVDLF